MKNRDDQTNLSTESLLIEIVEILQAHGIDSNTYRVYDYIDPDALEQVVASSHESLEIQLTIEDIDLSITQHGVRSLNDPPSS